MFNKKLEKRIEELEKRIKTIEYIFCIKKEITSSTIGLLGDIYINYKDTSEFKENVLNALNVKEITIHSKPQHTIFEEIKDNYDYNIPQEIEEQIKKDVGLK